jgi:hypothetical protein
MGEHRSSDQKTPATSHHVPASNSLSEAIMRIEQREREDEMRRELLYELGRAFFLYVGCRPDDYPPFLP